MEQHRFVQYQNKKIHYRDEGRDKPQVMVMLHGFLQNLDIWSSYTLSYMRYMRVITIDLPGHGYSDLLGDVQPMEEMAEAVNAVLEELNIEKCVMVGHSLGGYVALAFAEKYGYKLKGLGLMHSHALGDTRTSQAYRNEVCELVQLNRASYIVDFVTSLFAPENRMPLAQEIKDIQDECLETTAESIMATQRGMAIRPSRIKVLETLKVPILFVFGKLDNRLKLEVGISEAMIPYRSEIVIMDGVGHMSHIEARDHIKVRLFNFLNACYN